MISAMSVIPAVHKQRRLENAICLEPNLHRAQKVGEGPQQARGKHDDLNL